MSLVITCHLYIWRSSDQGQGHRSKKGRKPYSLNVNIRWAITPVLWKI